MIFRIAFTPRMVIPDEGKRRSGIHSVARDDRANECEALS